MQIENIEIEVIRKKIKNMNLRVFAPDGRVRLSAPEKLAEEKLRQFLLSNLAWIRKQQAKFASIAAEKQAAAPDDASTYLWAGKRYELRVQFADTNPQIVVLESRLLLTLRQNIAPELYPNILKEWMRFELKKTIVQLIQKWEPVIGVKTKEFGVKQMKTKWGTCNTQDHRIWLNLELAKKPLHCLEYVVVHELVHLLERNHTPRFWGLVEQFIPDWKAIRKELNA